MILRIIFYSCYIRSAIFSGEIFCIASYLWGISTFFATSFLFRSYAFQKYLHCQPNFFIVTPANNLSAVTPALEYLASLWSVKWFLFCNIMKSIELTIGALQNIMQSALAGLLTVCKSSFLMKFLDSYSLISVMKASGWYLELYGFTLQCALYCSHSAKEVRQSSSINLSLWLIRPLLF